MDIREKYNILRETGESFTFHGVEFDLYSIDARGDPAETVWGQIGGDELGDGGYIFQLTDDVVSVWLNGVLEVEFPFSGDVDQRIIDEIDIRKSRL